jgi:hypothetical protein
MAVVLTGVAASCLAAKNTVAHYLSEEDQREAEDALTALVSKHKTLRGAVKTIANGQELSRLLSQDRAKELLQLAALEPDDPPAADALEELIIHIGLEQRFDDFDRAVRGDLAGIKGQIERSEQKTTEGHLLIRQEVAAGNAAIMDLIKAHLPAIDPQIEKAVTHVKNRKYEIAIEMLEEFRARPDLTPVQRFRVLKFLGNAYASGRGDFHRAAQVYLDAKACLPDAEEALGLEAIARLNLGERGLALELANAALVKHPRAPGALLVKVRALPDETPFAEIERVVPGDLRGEADVAAALAYRAWASDEDEVAERYATRALDAAPEAPSHVAFLAKSSWMAGGGLAAFVALFISSSQMMQPSPASFGSCSTGGRLSESWTDQIAQGCCPTSRRPSCHFGTRRWLACCTCRRSRWRFARRLPAGFRRIKARKCLPSFCRGGFSSGPMVEPCLENPAVQPRQDWVRAKKKSAPHASRELHRRNAPATTRLGRRLRFH